MNYRQVEFFLAVCETGNLSRAAEAMNITEQALSKAIRNLEDEFGIRLFERKSKGFVLTEHGLAFMDEAGAYLKQHDRIVERFTQIKEKENRLSLAISTGLLPAWLPENFLVQFIRANPDTRIELNFFSEDRFNRSRNVTGSDLIIASSHSFYDEWELLFHQSRSMRLLMGKDNPLAGKEQIALRDLTEVPVALSTEDTEAQSRLKGLFRQLGIKPAMSFGPAEIPLLNRLIEECGYVSLFAGNDAVISERMTVRTIQDYEEKWDFCILKNSRFTMNKTATELLREMKRHIQ